MRTLRVVAQVWLVVVSAAALIFVALVYGTSRPGVAAEIAAEAMASAKSRAEIAASISDEVRAGSPFGAALPGVDLLVVEAIESRRFDAQLIVFVERSVGARLGLPVEATELHLRDVVQVSNPLVQAGIDAVPPIELAPASGGAEHLVAHRWFVAILLSGGALAGFVAVRVLAGRTRAAAAAGFGAMVGSGGLLAVPWVANGHGALAQIVAESVISSRFALVGLCAAAVVVAHASFADAGIFPDRGRLDSAPIEVGAPDLALPRRDRV